MKNLLRGMFIALVLSVILPHQVNAAERNEQDFIGATFKAYVAHCDDWISLRYAPSTSSERMAKIPLGTVVTVYDGPVWGIDGFYPVEYNGIRGYCLKDYLEYHSDSGAPRQ